MKKIVKVKRIFTIFLIFLLSINCFAAIVSDNDGSAFVTKAEFDALKKSFVKQIDDYNTSLDGKIDGAIAAYLDGVKVSQIEKWDTGNYNMLSSTDLVFTNEMNFPNDASCNEKLLWRPKYKFFITFMHNQPIGSAVIDEKTYTGDYDVEIKDFYRVKRVALGSGKSGGPTYELQGIGYFNNFDVVYSFNQFGTQYSSYITSAWADSPSTHTYWNCLKSKTHWTAQNTAGLTYDLAGDASESLLKYKDKTIQLKTGGKLDFYTASCFQWNANDVTLDTSAAAQKDKGKKIVSPAASLYNSLVPIDHTSDLISDTNVSTTISTLFVGDGETYIPTVDEEGIWVSTYDGHSGFINKRTGDDPVASTYALGQLNNYSYAKEKRVKFVYLPPYGITHEDSGATAKNNWWENSLVKAKRFFFEIQDTQTGTGIRVYPTSGFYVGTSPSVGNLELHFIVDTVEANNVVYFRVGDIDDNDYNSTTKNLKLSDGSYYKDLVVGDNTIEINEIKKDDKIYFRFTNKTAGGKVSVKLQEWVTGYLQTSV